MKKLLPLLAVLAVPAAAQDARVFYASDTWPVHVAGKTCTMTQAGGEANALSVSFDGAVVTLTTANSLQSELAPAGKLRMGIVFLGNGDVAYDDGWGSREFDYASENGVYRFSTRFAGERNVRQVLADLAGSEAIGFTQGREAVISYELDDAARSLDRLRQCAARAVASAD